MKTYRALFPFCGLGGGARGFAEAAVRLLGVDARFVSVGGIDFDAASCADFELLTSSPALCIDVRELTPSMLRAFAGDAAPDVVFMSPPCKGSSGLLSESKARTPKYAQMNELALVWLELMLATWTTPPRLVLFENVPRIKTRARAMLTRCRALLRAAGYVLHDGFHDCGELGGLAQRRRRFLLVARHARSVPPLLYQPPKKRVRGCGEVLGDLPVPLGDDVAGAMHRMPRISWLNWIRLALIPAGGDWRDLPGVLDEGQARREVFRRHRVERWDEASSTIGGSGSNGPCAVADPRGASLAPQDGQTWFKGKYGVGSWSEPARTVIGGPSNGAAFVADPRVGADRYSGGFGVLAFEEPSGAVTSETLPTNGRFAVADPRAREWFNGVLGVLPWSRPSGVVTGRSMPGTGTFAVGDPRVSRAFDHAYAVLRWAEPSSTVAGKSHPGNGAYSVADPRAPGGEPVVIDDVKRAPTTAPILLAADATWHRPLTTLELAALQSLPTRVGGAWLKLAGSSSSAWRERIGNAVPVATAKAIAEEMLVALVAADVGSFALSRAGGVWVDAPDALEPGRAAVQ